MTICISSDLGAWPHLCIPQSTLCSISTTCTAILLLASHLATAFLYMCLQLVYMQTFSSRWSSPHWYMQTVSMHSLPYTADMAYNTFLLTVWQYEFTSSNVMIVSPYLYKPILNFSLQNCYITKTTPVQEYILYSVIAHAFTTKCSQAIII